MHPVRARDSEGGFVKFGNQHAYEMLTFFRLNEKTSANVCSVFNFP